jgi:hypothetical protein
MVFLNNGTMQQHENFLRTVEKNISISTDAERTLFLAVILQALLDATQKDTQDLESHKYKREAILWFTTNNGKRKEDFEYICDLAEIEPNYMRRVAMEILTSKRTNFVRNHINALLTHKDSYDRIKLKNKKGK